MAKRVARRLAIKKCPMCGGSLRATTVAYQFEVGDADFTGSVRAHVCRECGEELTEGPAMCERELDAAVVLTRYKPSSEAIRFFRSVLNLKGNAFAELVGVAPETVSRWENGVRPIDAAAWGHLCGMVLDEASGSTTTLERLRANVVAREKPLPAKKLVLKPA